MTCNPLTLKRIYVIARFFWLRERIRRRFCRYKYWVGREFILPYWVNIILEFMGTRKKRSTEALPLTREEIVLAALSTSNGQPFQPVQVQKLFFLIDENVAGQIGGRQFSFAPYDYGPYDKAVYDTLFDLSKKGDVEIIYDQGSTLRKYRLTHQGQTKGMTYLERIPGPTSEYVSKLSTWIRGLSFAQLVSAIYKAYPQMKVNSVFNK